MKLIIFWLTILVQTMRRPIHRKLRVYFCDTVLPHVSYVKRSNRYIPLWLIEHDLTSAPTQYILYCPSVCLSHCSIISTKEDLDPRWCILHQTVVQRLLFRCCKDFAEIRSVSPQRNNFVQVPSFGRNSESSGKRTLFVRPSQPDYIETR